MVPSDRQPDVVESLGANEFQILDRVGRIPMFSRRNFEVIGDIRATHKSSGGQVGRRVQARNALHFWKIVLRGCGGGEEKKKKSHLVKDLHRRIISPRYAD